MRKQGKRIVPGKSVYILAASIMFWSSVHGQDNDHLNYDSVAAAYKNENAVITNYTTRLEIKLEDGKPVANSYVTRERLLISDAAPGLYNEDGVAHSSSFNVINDFDAWVYTPGKNGYKKTACYNIGDVRAKQNFVFYDDSWLRIAGFSGLTKKSRTEIKYSMRHEDVHLLPPCVFQSGLPTVKETFIVTAPRLVDMKFVIKGINTSWIKQSKENVNGTVTYTFTAEHIPAWKSFDGVPSAEYYEPMVIPFIASYKRYTEDKPNDVLANPEQLYKYLYKYVRNINMVTDTALDKIVKTLVKNDKTQEQKAKHIYEWVQKNMHYVAFENGLQGFVPRNASVVCNRKYGDCKDMASILTAMCRKAGLDAYFTWIGTRERPFTYEETPSPIVNDHMICAVKINDKWVFLDGTDPFIPYGYNPEAIQGKEAMIAIDANTYKIVTIPETEADKSNVTDSTFIAINENAITGNTKQEYQGYKAWFINGSLMYNKNKERDNFVKRLTQKGSDKFLEGKYDIVSSDSGNRNASISADFTVDDYVQGAGRQLYVNLNLDRDFANMHIDTKDRSVPYYFDYKNVKKEVVVLDIPKGYHVSHLPHNCAGSADGLWSYKITYKTEKKKVILTKELTLNTLSVSAAQFADNNKAADELNKAYSEAIVLSK